MRPRQQKKKTARRANQELVVTKSSQPPQLNNAGLRFTGPRRFISTGTVALAIAWNNLFDSFLNAISATAGVQTFDMLRINSIKMWAYSPSGTTTVSVSYIGKTAGMTGDALLHQATSIGAFPLHLVAKPQRDSTAADWQAYNTNVAFNIYCPTATVIDLDITFRNSIEGGSVQAVAQALVGAQPGDVYYRGFDGAPVASTKFTPQGTPNVQ